MKTPGKWAIAITTIGSIAGFLIAQGVAVYTFYQNSQLTRKIERVHLARELAREFYADDAKIFRRIRTAIESCRKLYIGFKQGGEFTNDEINRYLGFFDDVGFYVGDGIIDLKVVDQLFGAYIIEAYEYDELRNYVSGLQNKAKQTTAFAEFVGLAKSLEAIPERSQFVELSRQGCRR